MIHSVDPMQAPEGGKERDFVLTESRKGDNESKFLLCRRLANSDDNNGGSVPEDDASLRAWKSSVKDFKLLGTKDKELVDWFQLMPLAERKLVVEFMDVKSLCRSDSVMSNLFSRLAWMETLKGTASEALSRWPHYSSADDFAGLKWSMQRRVRLAGLKIKDQGKDMCGEDCMFIHICVNHSKSHPSSTLKDIGVFLVQSGSIDVHSITMPDSKVMVAPLFLAVKSGHVEIIDALIARGADPNQAVRGFESGGYTPLQIAACNGYADIIGELVSRGADVNKECNHTLPLHEAAHRGYVDTVQALLSAKANPNAVREDGMTPLLLAAYCGHTTTVQSLVDGGANVSIPKADQPDFTAMRIAVEKDHLDVLRCVLGAGVDFDREDPSPLVCIVCEKGNTATMQCLLQAGMDPNHDSGLALHMASIKNDAKMIKLLVEMGADPNVPHNRVISLHVASMLGRVAAAQALIKAKADVNAVGEDGYSALMLSVKNGKAANVQALIIAGADVNLRDKKDGYTACMMAVQDHHHLPILQELIKAGADLGAVTNDGLTALSLACERDECVPVVDALIAAGAPVDPEDSKTCAGAREGIVTPMCLAVQNSCIEIIHRLLAAGGDVNNLSRGGASALFMASQCGHLDIARHLITVGADANKSDEQGCTPLIIATAKGHSEVVSLLLTEGQADANATLKDGASALYLAVEIGHAGIVDLLLTAGADADKIYKHSEGLLYMAAAHGHVEICRRLLEAGLDANRGDLSALVIAVRRQHTDIVDLLLSGGADVNKVDHQVGGGAGSVYLAAATGNLKIAQKLCAAGADVNACDRDGNNALYRAAGRANAPLVRLLLANGADVRSHGCIMSLAYACQRGYTEIADILLKAGADPCGDDNLNIVLACEADNAATVSKLIACGADPNALSEEGMSPLFLAESISRSTGSMELLQALLSGGADMNQESRHPLYKGRSILGVARMSHNVAAVELLEAHAAVKKSNGEEIGPGGASLPENESDSENQPEEKENRSSSS